MQRDRACKNGLFHAWEYKTKAHTHTHTHTHTQTVMDVHTKQGFKNERATFSSTRISLGKWIYIGRIHPCKKLSPSLHVIINYKIPMMTYAEPMMRPNRVQKSHFRRGDSGDSLTDPQKFNFTTIIKKLTLKHIKKLKSNIYKLKCL